jgi:hypothetical protein
MCFGQVVKLSTNKDIFLPSGYLLLEQEHEEVQVNLIFVAILHHLSMNVLRHSLLAHGELQDVAV